MNNIKQADLLGSNVQHDHTAKVCWKEFVPVWQFGQTGT
jgi:hypothetical protein